MATCENCEFFSVIPKEADDQEKGKGDCVTEKEDEKGKYWLSRPVFQNSPCCGAFRNARTK